MFKLFLSLITCCLYIFPVYCFAASQEDLLNQLDAAMDKVQEETSTEELNKSPGREIVDQFADHFEATFRFNYAHCFESLDREDDVEELKLDYKTWAGNDLGSFHLAGWLEIGSQDETYAGVTDAWKDEDRRRRHLEFNELYALFTPGDLEISLGKKILPGNSSQFYSPSHVYHPFDLNVPVEPRVLGIWHAGVDYSFGDTQLSAAILPVFQDHKVPGSKSRWMAWQFNNEYWFEDEFQAGMMNFTFPNNIFYLLYYFWDLFTGSDLLKTLLNNQVILFEDNSPGYSWREMGYTAQVKSSLGLWDLFGSYYYGPNPYPLVRFDIRSTTVALIKENPPVHRVGGGFSTTWRNFEFHAEGVYHYSENNRDDNYITYFGGVTYTDNTLAARIHCDRIEVSLNYGGEKINSHQDHPDYYFSSETIRPFKDDILPSVNIFVNDGLTLSYFTDQDLEYDSQYHRFGFSYRLRPGLVGEVFTEFFDGDDTSFVGQWKDNDRVTVMLKWSL